MGRILSYLIVVAAVLAVVVGYKWYAYVTAGTDAYDEVGIELNSRMPDPLKRWGCAQLQLRFGNQIPPYGCADATGGSWR